MADGFWALAGYSVFVVGVADVDMTELRIIGSKPSERHVFVVDDYDAFAKIQDNLITFICETATSSETHCRLKSSRREATQIACFFHSCPFNDHWALISALAGMRGGGRGVQERYN